jgi:sulfur carrier protein ThiS
MVKLNFKLTERGEIEIPLSEPQTLQTLLDRYGADKGIDPGGCIAVCRGKVVRSGQLVEDGDEIDIFPAISGG